MKKSLFLGKILIFNLFLALAGLFKLGTIAGIELHFFSLASIVGPLLGFYAGLPFVVALYALKIFIRGLWIPSTIVTPLSFYVPTLFGAAYWSQYSFVFRFLVPLLCIVLFNIHPVGHQAFFYSLYWLIPLILYCAPQNNIFVQAVASTFIQHAVGSVLWLYCLPMTAETFAALMPVVIIERMVFVAGTLSVYYGVSYCKKLLNTYGYSISIRKQEA